MEPFEKYIKNKLILIMVLNFYEFRINREKELKSFFECCSTIIYY